MDSYDLEFEALISGLKEEGVYAVSLGLGCLHHPCLLLPRFELEMGKSVLCYGQYVKVIFSEKSLTRVT